MHVYFQMKNCGKNLGDLVSYNKCPDLCFHLLKFFFFFLSSSADQWGSTGAFFCSTWPNSSGQNLACSTVW